MADNKTLISDLEQAHKTSQQEFDQNWKPHFQELSKYLFPRGGRFIDVDYTPNDGKKRNQEINDGTGIWSLRTLAAGMHSGLTSPVRPWFRLTLDDKALSDYKPVKVWLDDTRDRILQVLRKAGFYQTIHGQYSELGGFGTSCVMIEKDPRTVARFSPFTIGEYTLGTDEFRRINTLYRTFKMQVKNVVNWFGIENVSKSTKSQYDNKNQRQSWIELKHVIDPNPDLVIGSLNNKNMAYRSVYWEPGKHNNKPLSHKGFTKKPFVTFRWFVTGSEIYGRSPGMDALRFVKSLHKMQEKALYALAKQVDPPMNAPLQMKGFPNTQLPGGLNFFDSLNGQKVGLSPVHELNFSIKDLEFKIEREQQSVQKFFYTDLFLAVINSPTKTQTAYEISRRYQEKLELLGPVIEQIEPGLDEMVERIYDIMLEGGLLLDPPQELEGRVIEIELVSMLAQAQKLAATAGIEQVARYIQGVANTNEEVLDAFDATESAKLYAEAVGIPAKIMRSDKEVATIRQIREQEALRQQERQENAELAQGAETLSKAKLDDNNALKVLLEAQGA